MMAWVGVVIIQAIVHFGIIGPRRHHQSKRDEQLPGATDEADSFQLDDEDEVEDFEKLLEQTGDEVISVSEAHVK